MYTLTYLLSVVNLIAYFLLTFLVFEEKSLKDNVIFLIVKLSVNVMYILYRC